MNPLSEHMEQDSLLSAFSKQIGKQSGDARFLPDSMG